MAIAHFWSKQSNTAIRNSTSCSVIILKKLWTYAYNYKQQVKWIMYLAERKLHRMLVFAVKTNFLPSFAVGLAFSFSFGKARAIIYMWLYLFTLYSPFGFSHPVSLCLSQNNFPLKVLFFCWSYNCVLCLFTARWY